MIDEGIKNLPQYHEDKLIGYAHNAAAVEKSRECPCDNLNKTILYGAKGLLRYLGLKKEMYEIELTPSDTKYPTVAIKLIHRNIPEEKIPKAESIIAYCKRELPYLIEAHLGYHNV
jgi:hypothetical protein